ncbi:AAA family ATPase [Oscillibacter valericigenes]|uniref:AAA family ATPase n=1 Tax=Oscillibacter valericigenes TaxID=351091 RepID=UPI001F3590E5|nr:AAA family ATPase [Oscillibacter valericigenes]MCF2616602.1 AAA family ATPase [Oscillibacter valericigenes]
MTDNQNDLITITAGELMDRQFLPRHSVVENFLPAGTFILSGQPKIGKSFLMLMLCWCVSEGKPFLGFETRQSEVLYLTLEDTDARIQERLARMFGTDWDGTKLHLTFRTTLSGNDLIQQLENFVFDHPETRLIVIDTLYLAREGGDGTAYSYSSDYKDIRPFKLFTGRLYSCGAGGVFGRDNSCERRIGEAAGRNLYTKDERGPGPQSAAAVGPAAFRGCGDQGALRLKSRTASYSYRPKITQHFVTQAGKLSVY